jgi:hypothetical protein
VVTYDNEQWLIKAEKGTLSNRKPSMTVEAARPQSWGVARLSFGMPKNVGRATIAPEKPRSTLKVEPIRSRWSQIVKSRIENQ